MLDLYCTNKLSLTKLISVINGISDHDIVLVDSDIKPKLAKKEKRKVYFFDKADWVKIREKTSAFTTNFLNKITQNTLEHNWQLIKKHIYQTIINLVPCKTTSYRYNIPWVTQQQKRAIFKELPKPVQHLSTCLELFPEVTIYRIRSMTLAEMRIWHFCTPTRF